MAGIVKVEDGSDIYAPSLGLGGALESIGTAIADTDARLSAWLLDVSRRSAPFMDFDLRGLSLDNRSSFWLGVDRAYEKVSHWDQDIAWSPSVAVIRLFYEKRNVQLVSPSVAVPSIDLDEIWFDDEVS